MSKSREYIHSQLPANNPLFTRIAHKYDELASGYAGPEAMGYLLADNSIIVAHVRKGRRTLYDCVDAGVPMGEREAFAALIGATHDIAKPGDKPKLARGRMIWIADSDGLDVLGLLWL